MICSKNRLDSKVASPYVFISSDVLITDSVYLGLHNRMIVSHRWNSAQTIATCLPQMVVPHTKVSHIISFICLFGLF